MNFNSKVLTGNLLNYAVRKALYSKVIDYVEARDSFSTCWNKGGEIIATYGISIIRLSDDFEVDIDGYCTNKRIPLWGSTTGQHRPTNSTIHQSHDVMIQIYDSEVVIGTTPLISAMRCFVSSRLGDTVDIPDFVQNY